MKFEVIFYDYGDNEVVVNQKFDSIIEATAWAFANEYDYDDIAIDEDGNDYWKTVYKYFNPEDKECYFSYTVREQSLKELRKKKLENINLIKR